MLLPSLPLFGSARAGALQLPGLWPNTTGIDFTSPTLSGGVSTALIVGAMVLVWAALRRAP